MAIATTTKTKKPRAPHVSIAQRMARLVSSHLEGGGSLDAPDLWQALGGTLASYFGESSVRTFSDSEEKSMDQFFGTLKKLVEVSLSSQRVALKTTGGSAAMKGLTEFRKMIAEAETE
ncbi:MAG: hypothetical protein D4R44_06940 [Actinobacteria bacterium]|nr:MAG: hypothetical protein D4R44_06940 [Actinomycetota bacterium]